jgi:hypothetical protein
MRNVVYSTQGLHVPRYFEELGYLLFYILASQDGDGVHVVSLTDMVILVVQGISIMLIFPRACHNEQETIFRL